MSFVPTAGNMMTGPAKGSGTLAGCLNSGPVTCLGPGNSGYILSQNANLYCYGNGSAFTPNSTYVWLNAQKVPTVPGPLPALGAAAAFGFSRKLRKRIQLAPPALGTTLSQI